MTADGRNFRSSYYDKALGDFVVEEKKSLNKLLQDNVRNHAKLKQFALQFAVPTASRVLLWGITLGIIPLHKECTEYVLDQRTQTFKDLSHAVDVIQYGQVDSSTSTCKKMLSMWLLENNRLNHPRYGKNSLEQDDKNFVEVVKVLLQIFSNEVEIYWIAKEFFACLKEIQQETNKLKELTWTLLKREDIELCNHLENLEVFSSTEIMDQWYATGFAGIISETNLVKVYDKICGGSRKIVIFVFLEMVKALRESLLKCTTMDEVKSALEQVKKQDAQIVNKAIKTWQSNKKLCEITVH